MATTIRPTTNLIEHEFQDAQTLRRGIENSKEPGSDAVTLMTECLRASDIWVNRLTPEEVEAIAWMTSNGSHVMNAHNSGRENEIWGHDIYSKEFIDDAVKKTNSAMDKAPLSQEPIIMYRGLNDGTPEEFKDSLVEGHEFKFPSHACASLNPNIAVHLTEFHSPTVIEVKTRRVASTATMSAWGATEMETLVDARNTWRVVAVHEGVKFGRRDLVRVVQIEPVGKEGQ